MKTRALVASFILWGIASESALLLAQTKAVQEDAAKREDIRKLIVASGGAQLGVQIMNQMIASLKSSMPQVPEKFWQDFATRVSPDTLTDKIIPIYDKYLTHDDIKGLLEFYQSPTGKKLLSVMPQIAQESMRVGQAWGTEISQDVARRLKEQGYH